MAILRDDLLPVQAKSLLAMRDFYSLRPKDSEHHLVFAGCFYKLVCPLDKNVYGILIFCEFFKEKSTFLYLQSGNIWYNNEGI